MYVIMDIPKAVHNTQDRNCTSILCIQCCVNDKWNLWKKETNSNSQKGHDK